MNNIREFVLDKQKIYKPKLEIGKFVKSKGILVPEMFDNFYDARKFKFKYNKNILVRSEHSQELEGFSGMLESLLLSEIMTKVNLNESKGFLGFFASKDNEIEKKISKELINEEHLEQYSKYKNLYLPSIKSNISQSYWELIEGFNGMIIRDDSQKNRYHIVKEKYIKKEGSFKKVKEYIRSISYNQDRLYDKIIDIYETINSPNDCPIVEFQIDEKDEIYFLQYHKVRKSSKYEDFKINSKSLLEKGFKEVEFVRGKTPENGRKYKLKVNSGNILLQPKPEFTDELEARNRDLQIIHLKNFDELSHNFTSNGHLTNSMLFKPEITVATDLEKILTENQFDTLLDILYDDNQNFENICLNFHLVSDGYNAYIKCLN